MFEARGQSGVIRCGYQTAARLGVWRLRAAPDTLGVIAVRLSATLQGQPSWWMTQRPLDVDLALDAHTWSWPVKRLTVSDGTLTADLEGVPTVIQGGTWERTDSSNRSLSRSI